MHAALISIICPLFIQSMLSRSFNSNYAPVSNFYYGSSRDLHGSQGNVALSVADGRSSGVPVLRVSTFLIKCLLKKKLEMSCNCIFAICEIFIMFDFIHYCND